MRSLEALERAWRSCPPAPRGYGHVRLIVARRGNGEHEVLGRAELSERRGLIGDRWEHGPRPSRARQLTLMNLDAARLVADGAPLHLPGDNLLVDFDLSDGGAPSGTRLRVGTALLEITDAPHTGCKKFQQRFGATRCGGSTTPTRSLADFGASTAGSSRRVRSGSAIPSRSSRPDPPRFRRKFGGLCGPR